MKVLIDGRCLQDLSSGIKRYTEELIKSYIETYGYSEVSVLVSKVSGDENFSCILYPKKAYSFWNFLRFSSFLKRLDFDIFHCPAHYNSFFKVRGRFYVTTVHDLMYRTVPNFYRANRLVNRLGMIKTDFFIRRSVKNSNLIVSISECTRKDILHFFGVESTVISNGLNRMASLPETPLPSSLEKDGYFLYVGLTLPHKNVSFLIDVFLRASTNKKLVICGNNVCNLQIDDPRVIFMGFVDSNVLATLYRCCSAFVYPSLYEGFGLPVLEALDAGARVFCSTGGALREFSSEEVHFFDPHNPAELLHLLETADEIPFDRMQAEKYVESFDWGKNMAGMQAVIRQEITKPI